MFAKLLKSKPLLIYLFGVLFILIGVYFGYQYYVKNVVEIKQVSDSDIQKKLDDNSDDKSDDNSDDNSDKKIEKPAYTQNKITSILPVAAISSVGPQTVGIAFNSDKEIEGMENHDELDNEPKKSSIKTYKF